MRSTATPGRWCGYSPPSGAYQLHGGATPAADLIRRGCPRGLSSEYLSRLFKEETGVKFVVYLNNLRLKHALRLLETTNLKVYEVAEQVGYSNLSYFSTVFKKNFGQNPFDYKNNCRQG
ncbi:MAG: helix-turn-helix domain-containing protein [Hungatella hathewayi]